MRPVVALRITPPQAAGRHGQNCGRGPLAGAQAAYQTFLLFPALCPVLGAAGIFAFMVLKVNPLPL